ncbi:MAG TPA: hypothetical protein VKY65_00835 [Alphaproteobacteria bacterium]|nr:hypothetical protein [Alphaproteobacteria bacterium]
MKQLAALAVLAALGGCGPSNDHAAPVAVATPPKDVRAAPEPGPSLGWRTRFDGGAVIVLLSDPTSQYRVERIELLGPDGARLPSGPLERTVERSYGYETEFPSSGFSLLGSSSTGIGIGTGVPMARKDRDAPPRTLTSTRITLPDPTGYRRSFSRWKIAIELSDAEGAPAFVEIPAPSP